MTERYVYCRCGGAALPEGGRIELPFLARFREAMLAGVKTMTSRTRRHGYPGDTFEAWGQVFVLTAVHTKMLSWVKEHWQEEGCESADDFHAVWNQLHPRTGFSPNRGVYVHEFRLVQNSG